MKKAANLTTAFFALVLAGAGFAALIGGIIQRGKPVHALPAGTLFIIIAIALMILCVFICRAEKKPQGRP